MMNEIVRNQLEVATIQVNVQFLQQLQQEWSRFVTVVKQTVNLDKESYHKLFDILKQYQSEVNGIRAEKIAKNVNPLALVTATQQGQGGRMAAEPRWLSTKVETAAAAVSVGVAAAATVVGTSRGELATVEGSGGCGGGYRDGGWRLLVVVTVVLGVRVSAVGGGVLVAAVLIKCFNNNHNLL
nr:Gag-Pol polyprotein [Tanacetum cinerariifolium]